MFVSIFLQFVGLIRCIRMHAVLSDTCQQIDRHPPRLAILMQTPFWSSANQRRHETSDSAQFSPTRLSVSLLALDPAQLSPTQLLVRVVSEHEIQPQQTEQSPTLLMFRVLCVCSFYIRFRPTI